MYRVVTQYRDQGSPRPVVERGPWHPSRHSAEEWADLLRAIGYVVHVESQRQESDDQDDNHALADALASMA